MTASKDSSHIKPALANGQNVRLQYAVVGDPVHTTGRPEIAWRQHQVGCAVVDRAVPGPEEGRSKPPKKATCKGKDGTCKAHPIQELGLCVFHARKAGVYNAWTEKEVASSTSKD